jgi:outer membrane protein TolC
MKGREFEKLRQQTVKAKMALKDAEEAVLTAEDNASDAHQKYECLREKLYQARQAIDAKRIERSKDDAGTDA